MTQVMSITNRADLMNLLFDSEPHARFDIIFTYVKLSLCTASASRLVTRGDFALDELCAHPPWSGFSTRDNYDKPLSPGLDSVQCYGGESVAFRDNHDSNYTC